MVAHGDVPADAEWPHAEPEAEVLAVVVRVERVELDVDGVARVAVLLDNGRGAHLLEFGCWFPFVGQRKCGQVVGEIVWEINIFPDILAVCYLSTIKLLNVTHRAWPPHVLPGEEGEEVLRPRDGRHCVDVEVGRGGAHSDVGGRRHHLQHAVVGVLHLFRPRLLSGRRQGGAEMVAKLKAKHAAYLVRISILRCL